MSNCNIEEEVWKDIYGYEGLYQVSNKGEIKSLDRNIKKKNGTFYPCKGKILTPLFRKGYYGVSLSKNGNKFNGRTHRIVAETFILNPLNKREVNHIDGNKLNNIFGNLEWVTSSENTIHSYTNLLQNPHQNAGENHGSSKMNWESVKEIRELYKNTSMSQYQLAEKYNVSRACIQGIVNGTRWKE